MDLDETWQMGLRPEKTKPCAFPAKSRYGVWRERENMGRRPLLAATFLGSISAKLSTNSCPGGASRHVVSYFRKGSIKGSNFPKNPLLGYPICVQPTGNGKRSVTPTFFPFLSGPPTDVPFPGDFCWGMYRFPAIHLRKCRYQQWAYLDQAGWGYSCATWPEAGHYSIGL